METKSGPKNSENDKPSGCDYLGNLCTDISNLLLRALHNVYLQRKFQLHNLKNYSFLCENYKILSGVSANRIKNVLPIIIGNDENV